MDIIVHGTKGGCDIFTPRKQSGLYDVGIGGGVAALGQHAYAISFNDGRKVLSRYEIIKDVRGDKRTGFIAFSLFLPDNERLTGTDIMSLLDRVSVEYRQKYIVDNNLYDVREDWTFLDEIISEYQKKLISPPADNIENLQSGSKDAAYIYYIESWELQKYFDVPYQVEYSPFKLIFFVKAELQTKPENPLNALRHGLDPSLYDLTGKIDLENKCYRLRDYFGQANNGVSIEIRANGRLRSNKDKIYRKDDLSIRYAKNKYYKEIYETGKLSDWNIGRFFHIIEESGTVEVKKDIDLPQVEKTITFEIIFLNGSPEFNTEIQIGSQPWRIAFGNRCDYTFQGEDLKDRITVSVKNGLFSGSRTFIPENSPDTLLLELNKSNRIIFEVSDDNGPLYNYSIQVLGNRGKIVSSEKEFVINGDSLKETFDITVSSIGYESKSFKYSPAHDVNPIRVKLEKNRNESLIGKKPSGRAARYKIKISEKEGKRSFRGTHVDETVSGRPDFGCDPRFGYEFQEWIFFPDNSDVRFDGYFEAKFKPLWYRKLFKWYGILGLIFVVLVLGLLLFAIFQDSTSNQTTNNSTFQFKERIDNYLIGDSLILDTLIYFQKKWSYEKPEVTKRNWFITLISDEKETDSTEFMKWDSINQLINKAITLRELITKGDYESLKKEKGYSEPQKNLLNSISKIDSDDYKDIRYRLSKASELPLTEITNSISIILDTIRIARKKQDFINLNKSKGSVVNNSKSSVGQTNNQISEIEKYLQGNELNLEKLRNYRNSVTSNDLKNSIDLCIEFWGLDGEYQKTYEKFQQKILGDKILKNSLLAKCVKELKAQGAKYKTTQKTTFLKKQVQ